MITPPMTSEQALTLLLLSEGIPNPSPPRGGVSAAISASREQSPQFGEVSKLADRSEESDAPCGRGREFQLPGILTSRCTRPETVTTGQI
jgi:hypothetical protein